MIRSGQTQLIYGSAAFRFVGEALPDPGEVVPVLVFPE